MKSEKRKLNHEIFTSVFALYLLAFFYVTLAMRGAQMDVPLDGYVKTHCNLIPFQTVQLYLDAYFKYHYSVWLTVTNIIGNLVLMVPMSFSLACFFPKLRKWFPSVMVNGLILIVVEVLQLVSRRGALDIDDFILNMAGVVIGLLFWRGRIGQALMRHI